MQAKVRKCLRSLARNESTTVALATIRNDIEEVDATSLSVNTVSEYLDAFRRIYLPRLSRTIWALSSTR